MSKHAEHKRKTLIVFPGEVFPVVMGSRRRVFNLIQYLSQNNICTDLLIVGATPIDEIYQQDYDRLANQTFFIESKSNKTNWRKRFIKKIGKFLKTSDSSLNQQETFSERVYRKENDKTKKSCKALIEQNNYSNIIISYAWMMWIIEDCSKQNLNIICDSYDVQYQRNKTIFFFSNFKKFNFQHEMLQEISYLKKADYILAISQKDYDELARHIEPQKMILCSIDFEYIMNLPFMKAKEVKNTLVFGFIGTNMIANILSIKVVIKEWWPVISNVLPHARLCIAGSIANEIESLIEINDRNIFILGELESLQAFYDKIDCLLFPNYVYGGINLKIYESIFLNKIILSNEQYIDDTVKELILVWDDEHIDKTLRRVKYLLNDHDYRAKTKKLYQSYYQPNVIYKDLKNVLR